MEKINITGTYIQILFVTDQHLKNNRQTNDFIDFLQGIQSETLLVMLGDVFQIWAMRTRFLLDYQKALLDCIANLREKSIDTIMVCGNKDVLYTPKKLEASFQCFSHIVMDEAFIEWKGKRIYLSHGDLVNVFDRNYLKLRKFLRSGIARTIADILPQFITVKLLIKGETELHKTNREYKKRFPEQLFKEHCSKNEFKGGMLFMGHFHPRNLVSIRINDLSAYVLPAWCDEKNYFTLDAGFELHARKYQPTLNPNH